jgi:hypothetical protein
MPPELSGSTEHAKWRGDDDWPEDAADERDPGWPDDPADERDPDWPDDWPGEGGEDPPWRRPAPPAAHGPGGGRPGRLNPRPLALAAVAVLALGVGAGVALAIGRNLDNSSSPAAAPSPQQSYAAPGGGTVPGGAVPGGAVPGGGSSGEAFIEGRVTAVSSTSITIGGAGQSMTAAITAATRVTGNVTGIGGIKVGDQVSAQITMSGSQATVTAIQDPAQAPSGGGLP